MRRRFFLVGVVLCAALLSAAGCASSPGRCGERRAESKESPDRKYTVATFVRKCVSREREETVTHVNLHGGLGEPPPDADGLITSGEVFAVEGARKVNLTWKDAKNLTVECGDCGGQKVLKREPSWNDVRVSFDVK
jgi:hypothetical protein